MSKRNDEVATASPAVMRVSPALAQKIGLNESIVLLQLDYLVSISTSEERDGKQWTYQQWKGGFDQMFPWMSERTLRRSIATLVEKGLVETSRKRTNWYTVNHQEVDRLRCQDGTLNEGRTCQDGTLEDANMAPDNMPKRHVPIHTKNSTKISSQEHTAPAAAVPDVAEEKVKPIRPRKDGPAPLSDPAAEEARAAWFQALRDKFTALARHEYSGAATVIRAACEQYGPDAYACWSALIATSNGDYIGPHLVAKNIGGWRAAGKPSAYALWGRKNGATNGAYPSTSGLYEASGIPSGRDKYDLDEEVETAFRESSRSQQRPIPA